jgi:hypothetical protein
MAKVTRSGSLSVSLFDGMSRLQDVIKKVSDSVHLGEFTDKEMEDILSRLALVIGRAVKSNAPMPARKSRLQKDTKIPSLESLESWASDGPIDSRELQSTLHKASKACELLLDLINVKEGLQLQIPVNSEAGYRILNWLKKNPEVSHGRKFLTQVETIMEGLGQLKHACAMAEFDLAKTKFPPGRPAKAWYVDFAELLIAICQSRGVRPSLGRNSQTEKPSGNLFVLGKAMEKLLPKELRSPSDESLFDSLKIAKKAIAKRGENLP